MARIPYPDPASLDPEIADRLERMGSLNVNRMMAHAPTLMVAYSKLGAALLRKGALEPPLRELVILRIGVLCESDYEWYQHVSVGRAVGLSDDKINTMKSGDFSLLTEREKIAVAYAEDIKKLGRVSDAVFDRAKGEFTPGELVELNLVSGFYIMTAGHLLTLEIEKEDTPPLGETMKAHNVA
ncbi:carboxymuconolactone decarboxylase family protein [Sphingobium sp. EM0848]|uniref:carboxymuconolactone decarboxylase family protein n=1 Tax=Sphingobium sp. EM0848 TaxID=2743473 RepID=UPI00159C3ED9|nr:carboxymuconolactone decarboxylase family protein [Sphingobium sp. EM0848]